MYFIDCTLKGSCMLLKKNRMSLHCGLWSPCGGHGRKSPIPQEGPWWKFQSPRGGHGGNSNHLVGPWQKVWHPRGGEAILESPIPWEGPRWKVQSPVGGHNGKSMGRDRPQCRDIRFFFRSMQLPFKVQSLTPKVLGQLAQLSLVLY
jgi:hypothetical protein